MEYILVISAIVVIIIMSGVYFLIIKKRAAFNENKALVTRNANSITSGTPIIIHGNEISIPITQLPATIEFNEQGLSEITDQNVITRISTAIPGAAQAMAKSITNNAIKNIELFKLDIPSSALVKSKEVKGALRAFTRNKNEITKNANLIKVDPSNISKSAMLANSVANVMNVASLVVGQYYMSEINAKLDQMNNTVNKINDFQEKEFKSRVLSLIARVGVISQFNVEILENDEQRKIKLAGLDDLNGNASELLGQVNETITSLVENTSNPDFKAYQKKVEDFTILVEYQNVIVTILEKIGNLTYLFGKGDISWDLCLSLYNTYFKHSCNARAVLEEWHDKQVTSLKIDLDKNRKSKSGVEGFFSAIPALVIDEKWKYKELKEGLAHKINAQTQTNLYAENVPKAVYDEDVQIIIKDGKYFYLTGEMYNTNTEENLS